MLTDDELILLTKLQNDQELFEAKDDLLKFTYKTMDGFIADTFHVVYYHLLDLFAKGKIKRLMITMPPQHGKK